MVLVLAALLAHFARLVLLYLLRFDRLGLKLRYGPN